MTPTDKLDQFTIPSDVDEPIEITIETRDGQRKVLAAWKDQRGLVAYNLTSPAGSIPLSISFLQANGQYPRKAATGWQALMVAFAATGLGEIVDVR